MKVIAVLPFTNAASGVITNSATVEFCLTVTSVVFPSESTVTSPFAILLNASASLADFYKNEMYESTFIEKIAIADLYFDSPELKNLLEKKLMMNVTHKKIELSKITATLAAEEVLF